MDEQEAETATQHRFSVSDQEAPGDVIRPLGRSVLKHHPSTHCPPSASPPVLRVVTHRHRRCRGSCRRLRTLDGIGSRLALRVCHRGLPLE